MLAALLILSIGFGLQWFAPWWIGVLPAFIIGFAMSRGPIKAFTAGFLGLGVAWLATAAYFDWLNQGVLSVRLSGMLELPHPSLLLAVTGFLGALLGALGCWAGYGLKESLLDARKLREEGWG